MIFDSIIYKLKLKINNRIWRRENPHNYTFCANYFPLDILSVGKQTYGTLFVYVWNKDLEKLIIGNYCSIAEGVKFILGGNHHYDTMLTYPFKVMKFRTQTVEAISKGPIVIEDDVWIGINALILCGVRIGKGAVIGAGSVVTKDVPPYSIVAGNPAKIIKKRFSDEIIDYLLQVDFNKINFSHTNIDDLYQSITNIDDLKNLLHKLDYLNE